MITLTLYPDYGFKVHIDDAHAGDICPSGDNEWAVYTLTATGKVVKVRFSTRTDILTAIDDLEDLYYRRSTK